MNHDFTEDDFIARSTWFCLHRTGVVSLCHNGWMQGISNADDHNLWCLYHMLKCMMNHHEYWWVMTTCHRCTRVFRSSGYPRRDSNHESHLCLLKTNICLSKYGEWKWISVFFWGSLLFELLLFYYRGCKFYFCTCCILVFQKNPLSTKLSSQTLFLQRCLGLSCETIIKSMYMSMYLHIYILYCCIQT